MKGAADDARANLAAAPFRLGVTSFVIPAGWADNVHHLLWGRPALLGLVRDVELLFFQADQRLQLPARAELERLRSYKEAGGLSYTLHTPLNASLASADTARRVHALEVVRRALAVAAPLAPERIVVHVYLGDDERDPSPPSELDAWRGRAAEALGALVADGTAAQQLCVETIDYDYALIEPVVTALGLSVALDIGHQQRDGRDELALWERASPRTRVVQWHGVDPTGRDHRSLTCAPRDRTRALLKTLLAAGYDQVLTLEVFDEDDLRTSLALLSDLAGQLAAEGGATPFAPTGGRADDDGGSGSPRGEPTLTAPSQPPLFVLVGGGARSGKSAFALARAQALGARRVFLATAQGLDDEMRARIARHRRERDGGAEAFITLEEPLAVPEALDDLGGDVDVVLIDCLTLWLSNLLSRDEAAEAALARIADLRAAIGRRRFHVVLVTNEVGMGLVPETSLGRLFRDVTGQAHQRLSSDADELYAAVMGQVLRLRPGPVELVAAP